MRIPGEKIKHQRKNRGLTQTELGAQIGVSYQQIMRYEVHGIENMRVHRLMRLAEVFECSISELI